ncbi:MAG: hypothetical protein INF48_10590 [Rhodobacter sp.]|nr:hypothetical protein [Rhodobacter sp.]MCA3450758.1 hypothetical protein [Rhodobacter sp.]
MGRVGQPFAHRCFGVSLHLGRCLVTGDSHNFMSGCPRFGRPPRASLAQAMRRTFRQSCRIAPLPHQVSKAIGRPAFAVSRGKERPVCRTDRNIPGKVGVQRNADKHTIRLCRFLATILNPPALNRLLKNSPLDAV